MLRKCIVTFVIGVSYMYLSGKIFFKSYRKIFSHIKKKFPNDSELSYRNRRLAIRQLIMIRFDQIIHRVLDFNKRINYMSVINTCLKKLFSIWNIILQRFQNFLFKYVPSMGFVFFPMAYNIWIGGTHKKFFISFLDNVFLKQSSVT